MNRERIRKLTVASAAVAVILFALLNHSTTAFTGPASAGTPGTPVADGATIFGAKCALCHGKDGAGLPNWKAKGQPDLTSAEWQKSHSDEQITGTVREGKGKYMPAFKAKLSDEEIAAVVARVRALGKKR
ncbi:MAG TPA: c-type cytochrome [Blastocatellia bacterium]|jgi:cbb3-type cytochrome c oxidase subunit III